MTDARRVSAESAPPVGVGLVSGHPSWPAASAFLAIFAGLGGAIGCGLLVGIVGTIFGADVKHPPPSIAIGSTAMQDLCFVGVVVLFAGRRGSVAPWQLGLRGTRVLPAIGWMAVALLILLLISYGWSTLLGIDEAESLPDSLGVDRSTAALVATAVLVTVMAPIAEELLFRAYVFPALRNWRGTAPAVFLTGLLFGTLHVLSAPAYALLPLAVFGSLLCLLYLKTRSLYPCIALHALNNCVAFGSAPEVGWDWQIPLLAVGALGTIALIAVVVHRRFGVAPGSLSPV